MYETRDVTQWRQDFRDVDLDTPNLMLTFAGIFGHLMLLEWDYNTTLSIANPLLGLFSILAQFVFVFFLDLFGVSNQDKEFFLDHYLPRLEVQTQNVTLTVLERAEVLENAAGTLIKIFYAFFWQESIIDLGGELPFIGRFLIFTPKVSTYPPRPTPSERPYCPISTCTPTM